MIACVAVAVVARELRQPPIETLRSALDAIEAARVAGADRLARDTFKEAERNLRIGEQNLKAISRDWWPFASYRFADSLLAESIRLSGLAARQAHDDAARQTTRSRNELAVLQDSLSIWRRVLDNLLPRTHDELLYRSAATRLELAQEMHKRGQGDDTGRSIKAVRQLLDSLEHSHSRHLAATVSGSAQWRSWADQTVAESRSSGKAALIVDKSEHRLYTVVAGRITDSFPCDLGFNSGHQKKRSGDGATPEGLYRVKFVNKQSKFYRALMLDYPNEYDRRRFREAIKSGEISSDSRIGGLIEVHGHGGTGRDWTDGGVAVTDRVMDKLLRIASAGTPVTIVRVWERP
jgi:hypothetical protein